MKVEELRAALEAAGVEDTEGTKPVLVERVVAAARAAAQATEEGDEVGYFVEAGHDVAVGNVLLGRKSDDGQYYNCVVEEVTETGYKVLFTEHEGEDGDREELPREHLRYYYADDDDDEAGYPVEEGHDIAVGNNLLGKSDGRYYDVIVEEVTETGYKVLFTATGDREELPRSACASTTATRRATSSRRVLPSRSAPSCSAGRATTASTAIVL